MASLRRVRDVLVGGTGRLSSAGVAAGVEHHVLCSIVGIEGVPSPYYRAKVDQEQIITAAETPWSIVRATQFYALLDRVFSLSARAGVLACPVLLAAIDRRVDGRARLGGCGRARPVTRAGRDRRSRGSAGFRAGPFLASVDWTAGGPRSGANPRRGRPRLAKRRADLPERREPRLAHIRAVAARAAPRSSRHVRPPERSAGAGPAPARGKGHRSPQRRSSANAHPACRLTAASS